jgi:hypothetical protein
MSPSAFLTAHQAAARYDVTTQRLASWARRGWISRSRVGTAVFYDLNQIDALIDSRADRPARPPIDERALAEAEAVLGIRKVAH